MSSVPRTPTLNKRLDDLERRLYALERSAMTSTDPEQTEEDSASAGQTTDTMDSDN